MKKIDWRLLFGNFWSIYFSTGKERRKTFEKAFFQQEAVEQDPVRRPSTEKYATPIATFDNFCLSRFRCKPKNRHSFINKLLVAAL